MDIILLEEVENLGNLGDKVTVKPGYARNFLVPTGKAKLATPANLAEFEVMRAELERQVAEAIAAAEARKVNIEDIGSITLAVRAGAEGKLFGSVGPRQIADAITAAGADVEKKEIRMPEGPIRAVGEYTIGLHLHTGVNMDVTIDVKAEK